MSESQGPPTPTVQGQRKLKESKSKSKVVEKRHEATHPGILELILTRFGGRREDCREEMETVEESEGGWHDGRQVLSAPLQDRG